MAERTHNKPQITGIPSKDDRPSQRLAFTFLIDRSITDNSASNPPCKENKFHLQSNEIEFFHSQKSVWFRQLLKMSTVIGLILTGV